jgi:hypothetical protein
MNERAGGPNRRLFLCCFQGNTFIAHSQNKTRGTAEIAEHRASPFVVGAGQCKHVRRYSMTNRLMMSVAAAALIAGTGFATAQGTGRDAPSVEHAAPPSATPMNRNDASGSGATKSDEKMQPPGGKSQRAQDNMKANPKGEKEKSAQENNMKSDQPKGMRAQTDEKGSAGKEKSAQENNMKSGQPKGMNAQTEDKGSAGKDMKAEDRNGNTNADSKGAAESKSQTVGQASAGGKLSGEQRTRISTVIRGQHVQPVTKVNFSISVGTRVPHEMSFHPLPPEVVTYYPEWRGYEFILVNDQIIVVDPRTFEIVAVLDA